MPGVRTNYSVLLRITLKASGAFKLGCVCCLHNRSLYELLPLLVFTKSMSHFSENSSDDWWTESNNVKFVLLGKGDILASMLP